MPQDKVQKLRLKRTHEVKFTPLHKHNSNGTKFTANKTNHKHRTQLTWKTLEMTNTVSNLPRKDNDGPEASIEAEHSAIVVAICTRESCCIPV